jgi:ribosomal protein S3AE
MLQVAATFMDEAKADVATADGTVKEVDVMVLTVELLGAAGKLQFILPLKAGARGLADQAQKFHQRVNLGIETVEGADAAAILRKPGTNGAQG